MLAALTLALIAAIPPLTHEQQVRVETARDGFDYQDEAFAALVEHASEWTPGLQDIAVRIDPSIESILIEPHLSRGELCQVRGLIEQVTVLPRPYAKVTEICLSSTDGAIVIVYLVPSGSVEHPPSLRRGESVSCVARFYKRLAVQGLDGEMHTYAAFVGGLSHARSPAGASTGRLWFVATPIVLLLLAFVALLIYTRRQRRAGRESAVRIGLSCDDAAASGAPLPEDPIDALTELRRRAED